MVHSIASLCKLDKSGKVLSKIIFCVFPLKGFHVIDPLLPSDLKNTTEWVKDVHNPHTKFEALPETIVAM